MNINMLDYMNVLTSKDKEVRDPVSGHAFPMSVNDVHAEIAKKEQSKQDNEIASMLTSLIK